MTDILPNWKTETQVWPFINVRVVLYPATGEWPSNRGLPIEGVRQGNYVPVQSHILDPCHIYTLALII